MEDPQCPLYLIATVDGGLHFSGDGEPIVGLPVVVDVHEDC